MSIEGFTTAEHKRLFGLAYRMLGSRADAEDVVQDAWIKLRQTSEVISRGALLTTIVTRLCIDRMRSMRAAREVYVGTWLPEPIAADDDSRPDRALEIADDLSFALLVSLEMLSPTQRAAFLLHDVFDVPFSEVSTVLRKSEIACRQMASRARKIVGQGRQHMPTVGGGHRELLGAFLSATIDGDLDRLKNMLADEATLYSDGGGRARAALNPVRGADRIARFFIGITRKAVRSGEQYSAEFRTFANGEGLVILEEGEAVQVFFATTASGKIAKVFQVCNPEKLSSLH